MIGAGAPAGIQGGWFLPPAVEGLTRQVFDALTPKSTTVASLLRSISAGQTAEKSFPSASILLLDVHGEYGDPLKGVAKTLRVNPSDDPLFIPYWATDISDVVRLVMGKVEDKSLTAIYDRIFEEKQAAVTKFGLAGANPNSVSVSSPIPFSKKLWSTGFIRS